MEGSLRASDTVRVTRDGEVLGEAKLTSLRHFKEQVVFPRFLLAWVNVFRPLDGRLYQVKEVEKGQECGLGLDVKFEVLAVRFQLS
jgi:hypothetical protein